MRLYFIRHGQTTGDVEGRYGGAYDDRHSPLGEQQVQELVQELANAPIERIFASSLKRAQQTAQTLSNRFHCPIVTLDDLRERDNYGAMTGLTKVEGRERYPDWAQGVKDRWYTVPGAESYQDASDRMRRGYTQVLAQTRNCAAVIWHGGGMRALFRDFLGLGELGEVGDCAWVELERADPSAAFEVRRSERISFLFT